MSLQDQIKVMSKSEKFSLMEKLWQELKQPEDEFDSPAWHKEILEMREGDEFFEDWGQAKERIKKSL